MSFKCEYCDTSKFNTSEDLRAHQVDKHRQEIENEFKLIKCEHCKQLRNAKQLDHQCRGKGPSDDIEDNSLLPRIIFEDEADVKPVLKEA